MTSLQRRRIFAEVEEIRMYQLTLWRKHMGCIRHVICIINTITNLLKKGVTGIIVLVFLVKARKYFFDVKK